MAGLVSPWNTEIFCAWNEGFRSFDSATRWRREERKSISFGISVGLSSSAIPLSLSSSVCLRLWCWNTYKSCLFLFCFSFFWKKVQYQQQPVGWSLVWQVMWVYQYALWSFYCIWIDAPFRCRVELEDASILMYVNHWAIYYNTLH